MNMFSTYKKRKSFATALVQMMIIMTVISIVFPILCSIPGIDSFVRDTTIEVLGNTPLSEHWLSLLDEFASHTDQGIAELFPRWLATFIKLSLDEAIECLVIAVFIHVSVFLWELFDPDGIPIIPTIVGTIAGLLSSRLVGSGVWGYIIILLLGIGLMLQGFKKTSKMKMAIVRALPSICIDGIAAFFCVGYITTLRFIAEARLSKLASVTAIILISIAMILIEIVLWASEKQWEKKISSY